jgi:hypothetical protein
MTDLAAQPTSMAAATSTALAEGTYDEALYYAVEWIASLTNGDLAVLSMAESWLGACVRAARAAAQAVYGDDFRPWTFGDLPEECWSDALNRACETLIPLMDFFATGFILQYCATLYAQARIEADLELRAALEQPLRMAQRYLELVTTHPDLTEMLEAMAGGWSGTVEDLELVARMLPEVAGVEGD